MASIDQYQDQTYLEKTKNWHEDESQWKYEMMKPMLDSITFDRVADVGCGAGKIIEAVYENYHPSIAVGYDITSNVSQFWEKRNPAVQFREENILDVDGVKYDLLMLIDVFEHVEDYYGFLRSLKSKSKYFVFHIPLDLFALALLTNNLNQKKESVGHIHYFTRESALGVLRDCGYHIISAEYTKAYTITQTKLNKKSKWIRNALDKVLGSHRNALLTGGYSLMVLAESD